MSVPRSESSSVAPWPNIQAMPTPASPIDSQVAPGRRRLRKQREKIAAMSGPTDMATSTLATVVSIIATMKAVYIVAQHRPDNQSVQLPCRKSFQNALPRRQDRAMSKVSELARLRQKVTSKLCAASRCRVTTPAILQSTVDITISVTAWLRGMAFMVSRGARYVFPGGRGRGSGRR